MPSSWRVRILKRDFEGHKHSVISGKIYRLNEMLDITARGECPLDSYKVMGILRNNLNGKFLSL